VVEWAQKLLKLFRAADGLALVAALDLGDSFDATQGISSPISYVDFTTPDQRYGQSRVS